MTVIDLKDMGVKFSDLVKQDDVLTSQVWPGDDIVTRLTWHSQDVAPGDVFLAIPPFDKTKTGVDHITQAANRNAKFIIKESHIPTPGDLNGAQIIDIADARHLKTLIAKRLYRGQPKVIVGVTGTNGKTSVVDFMRQIWDQMGYKVATIGTLGVQSSQKLVDMPEFSRTSPDPLILHQALSKMKNQGITHLALEASSHGIDQCRLDGVNFSAAGFTNLSHDHLDYHGSMEIYFEAKKRLFSKLIEEGTSAVLNADTNYFDALSNACRSRDIHVLPYGKRTESGLQLKNLVIQGVKQVATIAIHHEVHEIEFHFIGKFQVLNVLCAMGLIMETGVSHLQILPLLSNLKTVPGRLELVGHTKAGAAVYVDYAHTPDALSEALLSIRPYVSGVLTVAFGCGGERDVEKRSLMGKVAGEYTDFQIITDDNPRGEDPGKIRSQILKTCSNAIEISDRKEAITTAIKRLTKNDALLIAGKGHESEQIMNAKTLQFNDVEIAGQILLTNGGTILANNI